MKMKKLFVLLVAPFCCFAETVNTTKRDYTMVDLHNGLTTELLAVGSTSITISVEWPLDVEMEEKYFDLIGKVDIKKRGWDYLVEMAFDKTKGTATFEIRYDELPWYYMKDRDFSQKAWFAVRVPIEPKVPWGSFRGKYEEDDEEEEMSYEEYQKRMKDFVVVETQQKEGEEVAQASNPASGHKAHSQGWLCYLLFAVIPVICAVFYFVWRKLRTKN